MILQATSIWQIIVPAIALLVIVICGHIYNKRHPFRIPVTHGHPRSNEPGRLLHSGICPKCGQDEFYFDGNTLFCANRGCRSGWRVTNYGYSVVWAEQVEKGPDHLYR